MRKVKIRKQKIKVELHTHTHYSYDTNTSFYEIITGCKKRGIQVLGVSDHNEIEGAKRLATIAPFKVIIGQEILTKEGEVIGFFISKYIKPGLSMKKTISLIKKQGGVVYLPHPFDKTTRKTAVKEGFIENIIENVDIVETHNGRTILPSDNKEAFLFAKKHQKLISCGSDAHTSFEFGRNYLLMDEFNDAKSFLKSIKKAKLKNMTVMPWVFLITKFVRFMKKRGSIRDINELPTGFVCNICGSKKYKVIFKKSGRPKTKYFISDDSYGIHPQIVQCVDCELVYCYPRESEKKIVDRYAQFVDETYEKERPARKQNQAKIIRTIEGLIKKKGKILDVGAATGTLVEAAKDLGWKSYGIEPSRWAVDYAKKKYHLNMFKGTINKNKFKKNSFDAVTLIDVIEHVDSPRDLLIMVRKILTSDGIVVLVTPDYRSLFSKILGEKWWHIRPDHIYYFSHKTLNLLVESLGFKIVKVNTAGWNFSYDYWISRFARNIPLVFKVLNSVKYIPILNSLTRKNYNLNFQDSLEIYLKKNEE